jgi:phosphoglycerol transferase MdoB-like AlkP superfamily enzyme
MKSTAPSSFVWTPPRSLVTLALVYLFGLALFLLYRVGLLLLFSERANHPPLNDLAQAFLIGFRFDSVAILALLLVPTVLLPWVDMANRWVRRVTVWYLTLGLSIFIFALLADIRYFSHFDTHLNFQALQYVETGGKTTWHVTVTDPLFWPSIAAWVLFSVASCLVIRLIFKKTDNLRNRTSWGAQIIWFLLAFALVFLGIRGRTGISPIDWGVAYISDNAFVNQLGLNGVYTFGKAFNEEGHDPRLVYTPERYRFPFIPTEDALDTVRSMLAMPNEQWLEPDQSLLRQVTAPEKRGFRPNIILVLMESWTGRYTGCLGADLNLTPRFDSLAAHGILFDQFYATGFRTNYGMGGTLCAFPSLPGRSILDRYHANHPFVALPSILEARGYTTLFTYGGDMVFDNMQGFFKTQGVQRFLGENEIGKEHIFAKWGIPDHVVFDHIVQMADTLPRPFQLTCLTLSNHEPFDLPDSSVQVYADDSEESRVRNSHRYADFALGRFMDSMATRPEFDSTIFIFVSDHNKLEPAAPTPHPLQFRIPCLIYSPALIGSEGRRISIVGGQVDIIPTLMGLLGGNYVHASWGRDLLQLPPDDPGFASVNILNKLGYVEGNRYYTAWVGLPPSYYRVSDLPTLTNYAVDCRLSDPEGFARLQRRMQIYMQLADQLSTPDQ